MWYPIKRNERFILSLPQFQKITKITAKKGEFFLQIWDPFPMEFHSSDSTLPFNAPDFDSSCKSNGVAYQTGLGAILLEPNKKYFIYTDTNTEIMIEP